MQKLCALFLILSSAACATKPVATTVDLEWEFHEVTPFEKPWACLKEPDVLKLREALIRCEANKK
jgi:hypothetical protein